MYRTNPCIISAFQYDGDLMSSDGTYYIPEWAQETYLQGILYYKKWDLFLKTDDMEDPVPVPVGNYVALLPNATMISVGPTAFAYLFEMIEDGGK